jgi:hypothetical protein
MQKPCNDLLISKKSYFTNGLNTLSHLTAGHPHWASMWLAAASKASRDGRLAVRCANTMALPSRVGLKAQTASSPKAAQIFSTLSS